MNFFINSCSRSSLYEPVPQLKHTAILQFIYIYVGIIIHATNETNNNKYTDIKIQKQMQKFNFNL